MHHTNRQLRSAAGWMIGALVALFPLTTYALGLGKMTVRSALNEPLNAEIEISSIEEKELKGLQVGLAPREAFDQAGIERLGFLSQVKFSVSKRADGNYFIQLRTDQQIEEPFLHLLLSAEWPGGRLVREYTALIDPPSRVAGRAAGIEAPQAASSTAPAPAPAQAQPEPIAKEEPKPAPAPASSLPSVAAQPTPLPTPAPAASDVTPQDPLASQPAEIAPAQAPEATVDAKPVVEPLPMPAPSQRGSVAVGGGYQVKKGDTAWRVAEEFRASNNYSIEQAVLALYRTNPQAFFGNNVNNLKAGAILKLPEDREVESVSAVQARTQFRAQYDAWQEYKIKLAGASTAVKVVESEPKQPEAKAPAKKEPAPIAAAKETEKKEPQKADKVAKTPPEKTASEKPAPEKSAQQDELLKIVRSTVQGDKTTPDKKPVEGEARGAKERQALADRVASLEESAASRQMEHKELGDKISQVRAQLKREARLIQIEQKDMAAAQARTKPEAAKPAEPAPKPEVKAEPAPAAKVEPPKAVENPVEKPVAEAPKPAVVPPPEKLPPVAAPKKPVAPPPPAEEKGFVGELMDSVLGGDLLLPVVLGVVLLFSGGIALVYMNRRRKSIAEFEESILHSEAISGGPSEPQLTTDTSGQVVSSGDTSFLSDFSQGGMGNIHTDEVDPIAEAEVYLAYGRDETAEEILKEAIVKNPAREEIKLKLLEIYANRSDVRAFETLAEEMYAAMGGRPSKNWAKVEDLGRKLNPENPMFKTGAAGAAAPTAKPSFADTAKMKATMPPSTTAMTGGPETDVVEHPAAAEKSDFDFDMHHAPAAAASADTGLDFDLGDSPKPASGGGESLDFPGELSLDSSGGNTDLDLETSSSGSNVVDFDFGEKEDLAAAVAPETELAVAEAPALDAPAGDGGDSPQWDETATKLDLARAYIDMGDSEGAKSILQEVLAEGNDQQKNQAKELAAQIG